MIESCTVIELASVLAGPSVGQFFAELGATVIKVENPRTQGDVTRRWTLPHETPPDDRSAYFCCCNYGKQSVALDLRTERGQDVLHTLVTEADIVIANYRPGQAAALGADADTLRDLNPALLYGHITGYGPDNPRPGYDAVIQAESGFMAMNGSADGPPTKMPVALMDVLAAHHLKEALLVGLLRRTQTGQGAYVPVSLMQAAVSGLANQATNYLNTDHVPQRMGSAHPNIAPYGTAYATADTPVVLAVGTDRQFAALCDVLGRPALAKEERFATNAARVQHRAALDNVLRPRLAEQSADALLNALHQRGVPAGAVRVLPAVFNDPHAAAMTLGTGDAAHPAGLRQTMPGAVEDVAQEMGPPPHFGADTTSVLQANGYARGAIDALEKEGVIQIA
ncbi:carnitine dehydratase [Longimonas halophila]|uniref:Carnitine dehydratase n=1 Tax=Longimonas halophila TaxID=1469170 RepID=A0A2H3NMH4_9BACT|nr:CoA transferase [Longimonas halophila]PEN07649.1 carnitine dehydratase [Longimonas halophila]